MSKRKPGVSKSAPKNEVAPLGSGRKSKLKLADKPQLNDTPSEPQADATEPTDAADFVIVGTIAEPTDTFVSETPVSETTAEAQRAQESPMYTLVKSSKPRKGTQVVYTIAGLRGSVRFAGSLFGGDAPDTLEISEDGFAAPKAAKVKGPKLSAEERAAQLKESRAKYAALSPAEKKEVAIKNAKAAQERAAKRLAKLSA